MRLSPILFVCGVFAASQVATAAAPTDQQRGIMSAVFRYCSEVDPHDARLFRQKWEQLSGTNADLGEYRGGADFVATVNLIYPILQSAPREQFAAACAAEVTPPRKDTGKVSPKPNPLKRS